MLKVDIHEPASIYLSIKPVVESGMLTLNPEYADYMWDDPKGTTHEWERKTWTELLADLDSVELQLSRERQAHPEHRFGLIVEGVATPSMIGTTVWKQGKEKKVWFRSRDYATSIKKVYSWLRQVEQYMEVYHTSSTEATAYALISFYQGDQKEEHNTFRRHLSDITFHANPQVKMMMAIGHGIGIGAAKSEELVRRYGTVWNILSADPISLQGNGLGPATITQLLRKVGRPDV